MIRVAKYFAWFLILAAVLPLGSAVFESRPRSMDAIYCQYFAGSWHCGEQAQSLMVSPATWASYLLPFSIALLLIALGMLYGASKPTRRKYILYALAAFALWLVVKGTYTPKLYEQRNNEAANAAPSPPQSWPAPESAGPQRLQTASVTVWTKPNRSPATAHTEMYPQEDSILYLAYSGNGNAVAFSGLNAGLTVRVGGQFSVTDEGGFPARYDPTAAFVLYDVRKGWLRYSELSDLGRAIVQHFCEANRLAIYEVLDPQQADYLQGPSPSNLASVCGRAVREPSRLEVSAFDPDVPPGVNRPTDLVSLVYDPATHDTNPYTVELYVGRAQGGTKRLSLPEWFAYSHQNPREIVLDDSTHDRVMYYDELSPTDKEMVQDFCSQGLQIYGRAAGVPEGSFGTTLDIDFDQRELVSVCGSPPALVPAPFAERPKVLWLAAVLCGPTDGRCLTGDLLHDPDRARLSVEFRDLSGADQTVSLATWLAEDPSKQRTVVIFSRRSVLPNGLIGSNGIVHPYDTMSSEEKSAVEDFCQRGLMIYTWRHDIADASWLSDTFKLESSNLNLVCAHN